MIGTITGGDPNNLTGGDINVTGDFDTSSIDSIFSSGYGRLIVDGTLTVSSHDEFLQYSLANITANSILLKGALRLPAEGNRSFSVPITFYDGAEIIVTAFPGGSYSPELTGSLTFNNTSPVPVFVGPGVVLKITGQGADAKQFSKLNTSTGTLQIGVTQVVTNAT